MENKADGDKGAINRAIPTAKKWNLVDAQTA